MRIVWSDEAVFDYHQNIDFLLYRWSVQVAQDFIDDTEAILQVIQKNPHLFPISGYGEVRKAVIRKQITLYYILQPDGIYLIRFWNNFQDPDKLTL